MVLENNKEHLKGVFVGEFYTYTKYLLTSKTVLYI